MLADKGSAARNILHVAVKVNVVVRHLAAAFRGKDEHCRNSAIDIGPAIASGRSGLCRERVELGLDVVQVFCEGLEHLGTLVKREFS